MLVAVRELFTRELIRTFPEYLFVFGDNLQQKGYGGQAAAARGEPNTWGVATKNAPSNAVGAFATDSDEWHNSVYLDIEWILHVAKSQVVILPAAGLGTGRARLDVYAPKLLQRINAALYANTPVYNTVKEIQRVVQGA